MSLQASGHWTAHHSSDQCLCAAGAPMRHQRYVFSAKMASLCQIALPGYCEFALTLGDMDIAL